MYSENSLWQYFIYDKVVNLLLCGNNIYSNKVNASILKTTIIFLK